MPKQLSLPGLSYKEEQSTERKKLIKKLHEQYKQTQEQFADWLTCFYSDLYSQQQRKIMGVIAYYYGNPLTLTKIAKESLLPINSVGSQLSVLTKLGALNREPEGYVIADHNYLLYYAVHCDYRYSGWRERNSNINLGSKVDKFIEEIRENSS